MESGGDSTCICCPRCSRFTGANHNGPGTRHVTIRLVIVFFSVLIIWDRQKQFAFTWQDLNNLASKLCKFSCSLPQYIPQRSLLSFLLFVTGAFLKAEENISFAYESPRNSSFMNSNPESLRQAFCISKNVQGNAMLLIFCLLC